MLKRFYIFFLLPFYTFSQGIITGDTVSSSIIYKNFKDTVFSIVPKGTRVAELDLDGDSINDLKFTIKQMYSPGYTWEHQQVESVSNVELVVLGSSFGYVDSIGVGNSISPLSNWNNVQSGLFTLFEYDYSAGNTIILGVVKGPNKYIGFRKIFTNDTVYGWIYLNTDLLKGITIKSWAYEKKCSVFNCVGIQELNENSIRIYPNPASNNIHLLVDNIELSRANIEVLNELGEIVISSSFVETINLSSLKDGVYFLQIKTSNAVLKKKLIIQH